MADSAKLSAMIDELAHRTNATAPVVVIDAGIATADNLEMIRAKGYHYLCVSRSKLKDYRTTPGRLTVLLETKSKRQVRLKAVTTVANTNYYLEVASQDKYSTADSIAASLKNVLRWNCERWLPH